MAKIHIERTHQLEQHQLRGLVDDVAESLTREYALRCHWVGSELVFRRRGAHGRLLPQADRLILTLELGLLLGPLSCGIEQAIHQRLDELLSD
ncbi:polyhydroxyalkanoic acid system family protein [Ferrimonas pelagia]|uniref:Polyhydroxyalkanoic acid system protein n=1 Tax=Ferrimonas pelagia TaxID=1177826 RepID=A0ABP9F9N7_9GAMM